jgi:hypothetical protein
VTLEDSLGALLDAKLAPLRSDLDRVTAELSAVRRALPPQLVSLKRAAEVMHCSTKTAGRRVKSGEWPSRRDGGRVLVDLSALRPVSDEEVARVAFKMRALPGARDGTS